MYKLQCWDCPARMKALVPPRLPFPAGRTRAQRAAQNLWHSAQLTNPLPLRSSERVKRSFPYGILDDWNSLSAELFQDAFNLDLLQTFKVGVHCELSERSG